MGQILVREANVEPGRDGGPEVGVEVPPLGLLDDEHEAREARQRTVVEGVVEQSRAARADGRELFEAAETHGPAGREDDEGEGWGGHAQPPRRQLRTRVNDQSCTYSTPRSSYAMPRM